MMVGEIECITGHLDQYLLLAPNRVWLLEGIGGTKHPNRVCLAMNRRYFDPTNKSEDWIGNNAAFRCDACKRVYVVSGHLHKNGRLCPFCEGTIAHVEGRGRESGGKAWIEPRKSN